jgi:hypothetical protein
MNLNQQIRWVFLMAVAAGMPFMALGFPTQNNACTNCHGYPPVSINLTTDISSATVAPGQKFTVTANWTGGATGGNSTAK